MSKKAKKIRNVNVNNTTATNKAVTSPVEEKVTVTEEATETTEKVETVVEETTTKAAENAAETTANEAVPQETEEKEAPKSFLDDPDLTDNWDPETQEEPEPAAETEGESFNEDEMFADTPVDRIETITGEEFMALLNQEEQAEDASQASVL